MKNRTKRDEIRDWVNGKSVGDTFTIQEVMNTFFTASYTTVRETLADLKKAGVLIQKKTGNPRRYHVAKTEPIEFTGVGNEQVPCGVCGETMKFRDGIPIPATMEVAEFWDEENHQGLLAHGECGISAGMELA